MQTVIWIVTGKSNTSGASEVFQGAFKHLTHCEESVRLTYSNTPAVVDLEEGDFSTFKYSVKVDGKLIATFTAQEYIVRNQADHF